MGEIGRFGKINFRVQRKKNGKYLIRSFKDLKGHFSANYGEHPREGNKPYLEFNGLNAREYSMTIYTSLEFGYDPVKTRDKLVKYIEKGTPAYLILGNRKVCKNLLVIVDMSENYTEISPTGRRQGLSFDLQLKEYVKKKKKGKKSSKNKKGKNSKNKKKTVAKKTVKNTGYTTYTVKSGDTLWLLAVKFYKNGNKYTKIYNANKKTITNPNSLKAGWVLKIPK